MRIAIVNACHPDRPHVCAFRGTTFANILAESGNQVLLLTPPLTQTGKGTSEADLREKLEQHDWSKFCHVPGGFRDASILPSVRKGRIPTPIRQGVIAYNYLIRGNIYNDWITRSSSLLPIIANDFKPDIVWAIFGNSSCWKMGQALAKVASCPWVADIKDNWQAFVPIGLRKITAQKFSDAAEYTVLSKAHGNTLPLQRDSKFKTVYNGISPALMQLVKSDGRDSELRDEILITGSLYRSDILAQLLQAIHGWQQEHPGTNITYAGGDEDILDQAISNVDSAVEVKKLGSLSPHDLWQRQRNVRMNVYVRNPPNLFHHKLLELLAADRPILAYPGETDESHMLVKSVNGLFFACEDKNQVYQALDHAISTVRTPLDVASLNKFSSQHQAENLGELFFKTINNFSSQS